MGWVGGWGVRVVWSCSTGRLWTVRLVNNTPVSQSGLRAGRWWFWLLEAGSAMLLADWGLTDGQLVVASA